jgi:hypothetical protein
MYSTQGLPKSLIRRLQSGYSCANSSIAKAAQAAQHLQDVLINRVDVKQVVLHLPDDTSEIGQIATEDAELVHAPKGLGQARRGE